MSGKRLVFMDTETTGLEHDADVWDFAAIIRDPGHADVEVQFYVEHDVAKAARLPEPFHADYRRRYDPHSALRQAEAVHVIGNIVRDAHVVGAVPNFDTERIAALARRLHLAVPGWHYHLIDVETLAVGSLHGRAKHEGWTPIPLPWDSDHLSSLLGVTVPADERHTALGDARWARDLYDAVTT